MNSEVQTDATRHLTADEFTGAMIGEDLTAEAQAHIDLCPACRAEIAKFEDAVGDFSVASLRWSENLEQHLPRPGLTPARPTGTHRFFPVAAWALAAAALLGVMVPVTLHFEHEPASVETASTLREDFSPSDSPEQIAKDNALMAAIDEELSQSEASLLAAHTSPGTRERRR